jgi:4-amino-4-deoxy-L-arabinose transferase-like glycosyltransferase
MNTTRWFYTFLIIHILCWTLAPSLVRHTLPIDSNEATIWASHLQWGYDRDPYFFAICAKFALWLSHHAMWGMYFVGQCAVGVALWAVWRIANYMLPPWHALVSVMMLELVQYYNIATIDFDDNVLQMAMWTLTLLSFYRALKLNQTLNWIGAGLCAGLMLMTRYYAGIFLLAMLIFLLADSQRRQLFLQRKFYLGLLFLIIPSLPHLFWLMQHQWLTVHYVFGRMDEQSVWVSHIAQPVHFVWAQLLVFLPAILLFMSLWMGNDQGEILEDKQFSLTQFDRAFLFYLGILPLLITVGLSLLTGFTLRVLWGMSLLSLAGIMWTAWLRVNLTKKNLSVFIALVFSAMLLMVTGYAISLTKFGAHSSANFPAKKIAKQLTTIWHEHYHQPLCYVVGARELVGNIAFFSEDHPTVYIDADPHVSTWIKPEAVKQAGALFVWDMKDGMPSEWKQQFPNLIVLAPQDYYSLQNPSIKVMTVGAALLPPA